MRRWRATAWASGAAAFVAAAAFAAASAAAPPAATLTLREAERRAEAGHPSLAAGRAAATAADARAAQARAALLPQIVATASYRYATANRTIRIGTPPPLPGVISLRPPPSARLYDYLNLGVAASQLVYDFGQSAGALGAARMAAESAALDARAQRQLVLLEVRLAFFAACAHRELMAVAGEDLANQQRHLAQVQGFVDVQLRPAIDLVQAQASVGAAELRRLGAETAYALAKAELERAMGWAPAGDYEVGADSAGEGGASGEGGDPVSGEDAPLVELAGEARAARPDVASSERLVQAEERTLRAARGGYGPALHLTLSATDAGPGVEPGPFERANLRWNYAAALVLAWPLYEGGRTTARVREASAQLDEARARRALVEVGLRVELERASRGVAAARAAVVVSRTTRASARERLRLAEGRYQAGVGTALEVGDAQLGDATVAAQQVQARFDLAAARATLLHALGRAP